MAGFAILFDDAGLESDEDKEKMDHTFLAEQQRPSAFKLRSVYFSMPGANT